MLPIDNVLPDLVALLKKDGRAVLQAPPGAGKTTRVPLAIMDAGLARGRIIVLEPRRLAARGAASRMAETLGETVGERVGYRIRGETKVCSKTCIEVVTEGILTRMLQSDPELPGVGAVIFDEFHERSLNADLGLALCLEVADALREDLILLAMSATLDAEPVAQIMKAPILTSEGRAFPVEIRHLGKPLGQSRFEPAMAGLIEKAVTEEEGSLLAFLPGEGEIRRVERALNLPDACDVFPLYGAMPFAAQQKAIRPAKAGRRNIVLATAIAETSLTLPDIRIVVDGGRARRALFDPSSGMSRLVTERVTRAEATQRTGRAGRVTKGVCYRLWTRGDEGAFAAFPPPEIAAGDLTSFALELALWGSALDALRFVTPPHEGRFAEAQAVLQTLGALDGQGRITDHGRELAKVPLHPRLAHMLQHAGADAAMLAALLNERDPWQGHEADLALRLRALSNSAEHPGLNRGAVDRIRKEAKRLGKVQTQKPRLGLGAMAALAYPDRIGQRRDGDAPRFLLSGGKGAAMPEGDPLAAAKLIVATDLDGNPREAKIRQAAILPESDLRALYAHQIHWYDICFWSKREGRVTARREERFGALVLKGRKWSDVPEDAVAMAMLDGIRQLGLAPSGAAARFLSRARLMSAPFPDFSEAALIETVEDWLLPYLTGVRTSADWKAFDLLPALQGRLSWQEQQQLDHAAPSYFETPLGRRVPVDYSGEAPAISVRLQEVFGVTQHPVLGGAALQITLLSPAQRPVQVTRDLPGFWTDSYADVRKDMRGRYPKHPWPEDPTEADPTLRAKRKKPGA